MSQCCRNGDKLVGFMNGLSFRLGCWFGVLVCWFWLVVGRDIGDGSGCWRCVCEGWEGIKLWIRFVIMMY